MRLSWDTSDVGSLVSELRRVPAEVEKRNRATVKKEIKAVTDGWKRRATKSAGKHGKLYPRTIRSEIEGGGLSAITGPISSLPQGGMGRGFEWGGPAVIANPNPGWFIGSDGKVHPGGFAGQRVGQDAPHLDMTMTVDEEEPKFEEAVAGDAVPWW